MRSLVLLSVSFQSDRLKLLVLCRLLNTPAGINVIEIKKVVCILSDMQNIDWFKRMFAGFQRTLKGDSKAK